MSKKQITPITVISDLLNEQEREITKLQNRDVKLLSVIDSLVSLSSSSSSQTYAEREARRDLLKSSVTRAEDYASRHEMPMENLKQEEH